jgi:S1-C subfamily serine protease
MGAREGEEAVRALHGRAVPGFVPAPLTGDLRELMELPATVDGIAVAEVYPRTHAQSVDLRAGDIITAVNGRITASLKDMYLAIAGSTGDTPDYTVYRNGEIIELQLHTGEPYE